MEKDRNYINDYVKLIIISGPELFSYIYNKKGNDLEQWLLPYAMNNKSYFAHEYSICEDEDGRLKGMILAMPVTKMKSMTKNELYFIRNNLETLLKLIIYLMKMMYRMRIILRYPKLNNDEYYITNLAVFEAYRGQGIASKLMLQAEENARKAGLNKMSLFVEIDNENAIKLYEKLGYQITLE